MSLPCTRIVCFGLGLLLAQPVTAQVRLVWSTPDRTVNVAHVQNGVACEQKDGRWFPLTGAGKFALEPAPNFAREVAAYEYSYHVWRPTEAENEAGPPKRSVVTFRLALTSKDKLEDLMVVTVWEVAGVVRQINLQGLAYNDPGKPAYVAGRFVLHLGEEEGRFRSYVLAGGSGLSLAGVGSESVDVAKLRAAFDTGDRLAAVVVATRLRGKAISAREMLLAVRLGDPGVVEEFLAVQENVSGAGNWGMTPLHLAVELEDEGMSALLLRHRADLRARNEAGRTPLGVAAEEGNEVLVRQLLAAGARADDSRPAPLRLALEEDHPAVVAQLLAAGARLPTGNELAGWLSDAARMGHVKMVEYLLKNGAKPDGEHYVFSPLTSAMQRHNQPMIETLLAAGASPNKADYFGTTPMMEAAAAGDLPALVRFVAAGGKVLDPNHAGWSPLVFAAAYKHREAAEFLLGAAVHPPKLLQLALHQAVLAGDAALATELVAKWNAHLDLKADDIEATLDLALRQGLTEVINDGIARGLRGDRKIEKKWTLAAVAERYGRTEMVNGFKAVAGGPLALDRPPVLAEKTQVLRPPREPFPKELAAEKIFGDAEVEFMVDPTGTPHFPVLKSAADPRIGEAAVRMGLSVKFSASLTKPPAWRRVLMPFGFSNENVASTPILFAGDTDQVPVLLTKKAEIKGLLTERKQPVAVWLNCVINAAGDVTSTQTILSTDDSATPEALAVVRQWHFRPAIKSGDPVWCRQSYVLVLPDGIPLPAEGWTPGGGTVDGLKLPKLKKIPPLVYPEVMRTKGLRGLVVVKFRVSPTGRVENADAVAASNAAYAQAAVDAVESWRFEPAQKDGQPTSYDSRVSLTFDLYSY